jgi:hypothetical protein
MAEVIFKGGLAFERDEHEPANTRPYEGSAPGGAPAAEKNALTGWYHADGFGAVGDLAVDNTIPIRDAILAANGDPVYLPEGQYRIALSISDISVRLFGPGELVQAPGTTLLNITQPFGDPFGVTQGLVTFGPATPAVGDDSHRLTTFTTDDGSYARFRNGDVYHVSSNDYYPWAFAALGGNTVWKASFVPILGVGIDVTGPQAALTEGATIVGASSGATAGVQSRVTMDASNAKVSIASMDRDFVVGETLLVDGVSVGTIGALYVLAAARLEDSHATAAQMRKVRTDLHVDLDVQVRALGDPDAFVGTASRAPMVRITGAYNVRIRGMVRSGWSRAFQLTSCYFGDVDLHIEGLPNHALLAEQGYGYGLEVRAATEGIRARLFGRNLRHLFTTNPTGTSYGNNVYSYGTPKRNTVYDSVGINCYSAPFDTHEGAYFTVFDSCRAISSANANRYQTTSVGFNNRGFGTLVRNCIAEGCITGFSEAGVGLLSTFVYLNRYEGCTARDFGFWGYSQSVDAIDANSRIEIVDMDVRGDGSAANAPYYQYGYRFRGGITTVQYSRCSRSNGGMWNALGAATLTLDHFTADYRDTSGANVIGGRVDATLTQLDILDYTVIPGPASPATVFRNGAGNTAWNIDGVHCTAATMPPLYVSNGGAPTWNIRDRMAPIRPIGSIGNANVTLTPRSSQPTQVCSTPLTADRTVTLSTTACVNGDSFRVVRTAAATGAFTLTVAGKALAAGQWADVQYDGAAWLVVASGAL